jgi:hypothetical protein
VVLTRNFTDIMAIFTLLLRIKTKKNKDVDIEKQIFGLLFISNNENAFLLWNLQKPSLYPIWSTMKVPKLLHIHNFRVRSDC